MVKANRPKQSVKQMAEHIIDLACSDKGNVGAFVINGKLIVNAVGTAAFEKHSERYFDSMVGVYASDADFRAVKADLELFV